MECAVSLFQSPIQLQSPASMASLVFPFRYSCTCARGYHSCLLMAAPPLTQFLTLRTTTFSSCQKFTHVHFETRFYVPPTFHNGSLQPCTWCFGPPRSIHSLLTLEVHDEAPMEAHIQGGVVKVKNELQEARVLPISNRHAFFRGSSSVCLFPPWASILKTRVYPPLVFSDRSMSIKP
jgi:hypothetical protein